MPQTVAENVEDVEIAMSSVTADAETLQQITNVESALDSLQSAITPDLTPSTDDLPYPESISEDVASYVEEVTSDMEAVENLYVPLESPEIENMLPVLNDIEEIELIFESRPEDMYLEDVLDFPSPSFPSAEVPFPQILAAENASNSLYGYYGNAFGNMMRPLRSAFPSLQSQFGYVTESPLATFSQFSQYGSNVVPLFRLSKRSPEHYSEASEYGYETESVALAAQSGAEMMESTGQIQSAAGNSHMGMMESAVARLRNIEDTKFGALRSTVDGIIALNDKKLDMIDSIAQNLENLHESLSLSAISSVTDSVDALHAHKETYGGVAQSVANSIRGVDDFKMGALRSAVDGLEAIKDMKMDALQSAARTIDSKLGLGSSNFADVESMISADSSLSMSEKSLYLRQLSAFTPAQMEATSELLGLFSNPTALLHHGIENVNLAKADLLAASEAMTTGDIQAATSYALSAISHLQDSCPICSTLKHCIQNDPNMLPFVLSASETLLSRIPS